MLVEFGHFCLILALIMAVIQVMAGLGPWQFVSPAPKDMPRQKPKENQGPTYRILPAVRLSAILVFLLITAAFAALTMAYVSSDFSVANVVANSHSAKPLLYKITGVWGNHEGSMLLWVLILALFGAILAWFPSASMPDNMLGRSLGVQGGLNTLFLLFIILTSNPFLRLDPAPLDGQDLNPILQDPGLAFHPPLLYLGYVGFSLVFSLALGGLITGQLGPQWAKWARIWVMSAWAALTAGIALGSWWAYYELGWGGWWFWDPVENASLMPWLTGTALFHSLCVVEKRRHLLHWVILLAIITFGLSMLGTFLVRSGILVSVHSFAVDPDRGLFILLILLLSLGSGLALYGWRIGFRTPKIEGQTKSDFAFVSRESALVINNLFLVTATGTILVGTLYPLFISVTGGQSLSVGPPYFNLVFLPLMMPMLILAGLSPKISWQSAKGRRIYKKARSALWAALAVVIASLFVIEREWALASMGLGVGFWVIFAALSDIIQHPDWRIHNIRRALQRIPRRFWAQNIAHIGLGVMVLGITASSLWMEEEIGRLQPGEQLALHDYDFTLLTVQSRQGPNYTATQAVIDVRNRESDDHITTLLPENRFYPAAGQYTTEAAIFPIGATNLYLNLGDNNEQGWVIRAWRHPQVILIWLGAALMTLGGVISASTLPSQRRYNPSSSTRAETI